MRIIIDFYGSKMLCRVTHYLNEKNPHYNDYTDIKDIEDDVWRMCILAIHTLAKKLMEDYRPLSWESRKKKYRERKSLKKEK